MSEYSETLETTKDGRFRVRLVLDNYPSEPYDDGQSPLLQISRTGYGIRAEHIMAIGRNGVPLLRKGRTMKLSRKTKKTEAQAAAEAIASDQIESSRLDLELKREQLRQARLASQLAEQELLARRTENETRHSIGEEKS